MPLETEPDETMMRRAIDDELLSLLRSQQSSRSTPPPASDVSDWSTPSPAPAPIVQRTSEPIAFQQPIQRAITIDENQPNTVQDAKNGRSDDGLDVDRLARDVYKMLQNRLRIERERRAR